MKNFGFFLLLGLSALSAYAGDDKAVWNDQASWSLKTGVYTGYLGAIGKMFTRDQVLIQELGVTDGSFNAAVWNSTGLGARKYGKTLADEWDVTVGWSHMFGIVRYDVSGSLYFIAELSRLNDDLLTVDQQLSIPIWSGLAPYIKVRAFNRIGSKSPEAGWFVWAGFQRVEALFGQEINLDVSTAYSDGPLGKEPGFVFSRFTANTSFAITRKYNLVPSIVLQVPFASQKRTIRSYTTQTEVVGGLTLVRTF